MAGKANAKNKPNAVRRTMDWGAKMLQGFKPIEAALFGLGGYYLGDVLDATGLTSYLRSKIPAYNDWVNAGYSSGAPNAHDMFGNGGGPAITKLAGVGTFVATLAKAAKSGLTPKAMNSSLAFSIGAMLDGPPTFDSSAGERW